MDRTEYFYRETNKHIRNVQLLLNEAVWQILTRARVHDRSKFSDEEKQLFIELTPELSKVEYGSDEYRKQLERLRPAIEHHNKNNRHHPESFKGKIEDMNLLDLLEMLCDWIAATKRNPGGDIARSIALSKQRFGFSDELEKIFKNTVYVCFSYSERQLEAGENFTEEAR